MKKSEISREKILLALQSVLAEDGLHATTFQSVAAAAKVSQALVVKTFGNREALIRAGFMHLLAEARERTLANTQTPEDVRSGLEAYVNVTIEIFTARSTTPKMYVLLYYLSSFDKEYEAFNSEIKRVAVQRIQSILDLAPDRSVFHPHAAKVFHSSLTGLLINSVTEVSEYDLKTLGSEFVASFLGGDR